MILNSFCKYLKFIDLTIKKLSEMTIVLLLCVVEFGLIKIILLLETKNEKKRKMINNNIQLVIVK
jgi:hypothetical protein